jgi:hypothetical protein
MRACGEMSPLVGDLAPPISVVDVGRYIGLSAAFFAHTYPEAMIIAIEPDARNYELLMLNTTRFPNLHAVRAAVWKASGTISHTDPGFELHRNEDVLVVRADSQLIPVQPRQPGQSGRSELRRFCPCLTRFLRIWR